MARRSFSTARPQIEIDQVWNCVPDMLNTFGRVPVGLSWREAG